MKSTLILLVVVGALMHFGDTVNAWNRQFFNRYSRNLLRNGDANPAVVSGGNQVEEFNTLFGINGEGGNGPEQGGAGPGNGLGGGIGQQQTEVYGIVEPIFEDLPCVDRPCNVNDDCCPTGVCVSTYGEGKCIYVYGRKRDLCHRNADCDAGLSCLKGIAGNMVCQPTAQTMHLVEAGNTKAMEMKQFQEKCLTSSDCNVAKGMCCQLQRTHHRLLPKKVCAYFRDPFMCIDIMPTEDEEIRESRFLASFSQRRM